MSDTQTSIPKVRVNDSPRLPDETGVSATSRTQLTHSPAGNIVFEVRGATALAPVIEIDRLWDAAPGTISQTVRALELLKQVSDFLAAAQRADRPMDVDRFVQRAQLALPKLFACRSVGEGFAVIVNSLHFAFANLHGAPLRPDQLNVIWRVLRELRDRPAMSLEQGIQRVEELEDRGLEVDPPELGELLDDPGPSDNE